MFEADVHSSMGFPGLRVGGRLLNVATSHGAATYWRAAYTLHSTNLPWAQARGTAHGRVAWPLRVPLPATWQFAPLRDRAVVLQWGAYARAASATARRAARWRARSALRNH